MNKNILAIIILPVILVFLISCQTIPASQTLNKLDQSLSGISQDAGDVGKNNQKIIDDLKKVETIEDVKPVIIKAENNQIKIDQLNEKIKSANALTDEAINKVSKTEQDLNQQKKANGVLWKWIWGLAAGATLAAVGLIVVLRIKR